MNKQSNYLGSGEIELTDLGANNKEVLSFERIRKGCGDKEGIYTNGNNARSGSNQLLEIWSGRDNSPGDTCFTFVCPIIGIGLVVYVSRRTKFHVSPPGRDEATPCGGTILPYHALITHLLSQDDHTLLRGSGSTTKGYSTTLEDDMSVS